jgi:hypothetical protein
MRKGWCLPALILASLFVVELGSPREVLAINECCACDAKCRTEGYLPDKVTSCLKDEKCKADLKDPNDKCTLTCVKGTNKETVEGKCVRTYK